LNYEKITTTNQLRGFCQTISSATAIAFDTEFVAEHTYRPQLCLIQIAAADKRAIVDTLSVDDVTPFWELLANGDHQTIVHAGREEVGFSLTAIGKPPANLFDLQIAAGLIGLDYPAGYSSLAQKLLGVTPAKGETRTDWRRRPLTDRQLAYALGDVLHLEPMRDKLAARLVELQRMEWLAVETEAWLEHVNAAYRRDRWRRVSGISGLSARSKAVVRELWFWRETEAERRDMPVRRVLRDDLLIEIAKRQLSDAKRIQSIRGMDRNDLRRVMPELSECVVRAMQLADEELPRARHRKRLPPQLNMLGQFLSAALTSICKQAELAPSIVGNPSDVRELIAYQLGYFHDGDEPPVLAQGWRADVVGNLIDDLLAGKVSIRITDPKSERPLSFERRKES
jgi:ribonuclease D